MSSSELQLYENMSRLNQMIYLANAQNATWRAETLFPTSLYNGIRDAFRHAFGNAKCTIDMGTSLTESLTSAHEERADSYTYSYKEKEMDLFNNGIGRAWADFESYGFNSLEECILYAINSGVLKYLNNLDNNGQATATSQLIPTNQ